MKSHLRFTSLFFLQLCAVASSATLHVDDDNQTGNQQGSVKFPYNSIQSAVTAAANGDTIKVAVGKYGAVTTLGKSLTLLGGYPGASSESYAAAGGGDFSAQRPAPSATIISGGAANNGVTFTRFDSNPYQAKLDNFTIRNSRKGVVCDTEFSFPHPANVIISRNRIENNGAPNNSSVGGGIIVAGNNISILGNIIRGNQGGRGAGIMRVSGTGKLKIANNRILENLCYDDHGGGVMIFGAVTMTRNLIARNRINFDYGWGGGVIMHTVGTLRSGRNIIRENHCPSYGGGFFLDEGASAVLRSDLIDHNTTETGYGGGAAVDDGAPGASELELTNCTIVFNNPGGTEAEFGGNGLFLDDQGNGTSALVANCIFWGNGNGDDFFRAGSGAQLRMTFSNSREAYSGNGNRTTNPGFVNASQGDFILRADSPCVNTGENQEWMANAQDLADNRRLVGSKVDRGCYERQ